MELVCPSRCQLSTVTVSRYLWVLTARTLFLAKDRLPRSWWIYFFRKSISGSFVLLCLGSVTALRILPGPSSRGASMPFCSRSIIIVSSAYLITRITRRYFSLQQDCKQCYFLLFCYWSWVLWQFLWQLLSVAAHLSGGFRLGLFSLEKSHWTSQDASYLLKCIDNAHFETYCCVPKKLQERFSALRVKFTISITLLLWF